MDEVPVLTVDLDGSYAWRLTNGDYHREDGPAVRIDDGSEFWFLNGKKHRLDGPACKYTKGVNEWWQYGNLHREDGPAIEYTNGNMEWYIYGEKLDPNEYVKIKNPNYPKLVQMMIVYLIHRS